jgi:hypothetical protein
VSDVLTSRVLNRTLLARQHLLERSTLTTPEMCERLVGLQAQDVLPPFIGLWSRIADFDPESVSRGLHDRSLARITLMRGTIHLVTADDAVRIAGHIQPELEKAPFRKGFNYGATVGLDPEDVRARGERLIGEEPVSTAALRALVAAEWPDRDPGAMMQTLLFLLPVLQVPPRGAWRHNERPVWSRIQPWLGRDLEPDYPRTELLLRYLAAFGPASAADAGTWSRLTGLRADFEALGDRLRRYTDADGRVLYDLADGVLADPDRPAPVRFLGWYDNAVLSHSDRTRIVPAGVAPIVPNSGNSAPVLVDGFLAARHRIVRAGDRARLVVTPLRPLTAAEREDVLAEGARLLEFLEPDPDRDVELAAAK